MPRHSVDLDVFGVRVGSTVNKSASYGKPVLPRRCSDTHLVTMSFVLKSRKEKQTHEKPQFLSMTGSLVPHKQLSKKARAPRVSKTRGALWMSPAS